MNFFLIFWSHYLWQQPIGSVLLLIFTCEEFLVSLHNPVENSRLTEASYLITAYNVDLQILAMLPKYFIFLDSPDQMLRYENIGCLLQILLRTEKNW